MGKEICCTVWTLPHCYILLVHSGKKVWDAGLLHILTEYGVLAKGSKKGFLNGKHYNREMRCHRVCCEALSILSLERFFESLNDEGTVSALTDLVQSLDLLYASGDFENIEKEMQQPYFKVLLRIQ